MTDKDMELTPATELSELRRLRTFPHTSHYSLSQSQLSQSHAGLAKEPVKFLFATSALPAPVRQSST